VVAKVEWHQGRLHRDQPQPAKRVVKFDHGHGTPSSTSGKARTRTWTRLFCRTFRSNPVRLHLRPSATSRQVMRTLALPQALTTLRKAGQHRRPDLRHGRYVVFQLVEVAVSPFLPRPWPSRANVGCLKLPTAASWPCNRRDLAGKASASDGGQGMSTNMKRSRQ
jgi:hypothetical protein